MKGVNTLAAFFNLTLDTLAPQGVTLSINDGALYTAKKAVTIAIGCSDASTTGYSMKVYGSVTGAATADEATWETFATSKTITLTDGDGLKTIYVIVRDNVWNEAAPVSATITLNTAIPVVTITGPDTSIISEVVGKNTSKFNFTASEVFTEYKVGIVPANTSTVDDVTVIGTTNGSRNTSGSDGSYPKETNIEVTINGTDFKTAAGGSDGTYIIKAFVKNQAGTWSA